MVYLRLGFNKNLDKICSHSTEQGWKISYLYLSHIALCLCISYGALNSVISFFITSGAEELSISPPFCRVRKDF